jgi:hypothetical protein
MKGRFDIRARLVLAVALLLAACGESPVEVTLAVEGPIVEITLEPRVMILVQVQGRPDLCGYHFLVDSRTEISRSSSNADADIDDLTVGLRVRMWVAGDYSAGCPATGRAARVVIVDD